ncbi:MAG: DUF1302 family protein [Gammaproteobacteria bacterium]|nr:DUF1302 family protein [Gammaproteobacteria bacterium]
MQRWGLGLLCLFLSFTQAWALNNIDELLRGFEEQAEEAAQEEVSEKPGPEKTDIDALMDGFGNEESVAVTPETPSRMPSWLSFGGYSSFSASINYQHDKPASGKTDFRGLSRARLKILPEVKIDLPRKWDVFTSGSGFYDGAFRYNGRDQYASTYLDVSETELELRELWVRGAIAKVVDIKLGRQIVVWGKSDSLRVVDVINPLDMREPGMVDIEDLRLPVAMLRGDYFQAPWSVTALVIPEIRSNKFPGEGSDFFPVPFPLPPEKRPEHWRDSEFALAISGEFSAWDLSVHFASVYEDQAHFKLSNASLQRAYSRVSMGGVATNLVVGSWLIKSELAVFDGIQFFNTGDNKFSRGDLMAGVDYSGINNHIFSVEALWSHLFDYQPALIQAPDDREEEAAQIVFRYTGNFLRETLQIVALGSVFGLKAEGGGFYRVSAKYIPMDALSVSAGVIAYQSGDRLFLDAVARNDRVFGEIRYDF